MKYTIHTTKGGEFEIEPDRILANDVRLPWEHHPYPLRAWVLGNEYGAMGLVWATNESDAFDALVDADLAGGILIDEANADEDTARLGNAGEPCNLTYAWAYEVAWDLGWDCQLLCAFAEARGNGSDNLDS